MNLKYLKEVINKRTVAILTHGKSIEQLENYIELLADFNICYIGLGLFPLFEKYILSKVDKNLDIVFDCATVPHARLDHYERIRLPRIHEFLNRPDENLVIVSYGLIRDSVQTYMPELLINFSEKILKVDDLFPKEQIPYWMSVPNSIALAIGSVVASGTKKIITFGLDGYNNDISKGLDSYYHPEEHGKERLAALGTIFDAGINRDTLGFNGTFEKRFIEYQNLFNNYCSIYNCSPNSFYKFPKIIDYNNLIKILNE